MVENKVESLATIVNFAGSCNFYTVKKLIRIPLKEKLYSFMAAMVEREAINLSKTFCPDHLDWSVHIGKY